MSEKLSVILPNFNHARYLENAIDSILSQTYSNTELICFDDASTDGSQEIIKKFANLDGRMKIKFLDKNVGARKIVEMMMLEVTGKYLYSISADDYLVEKYFFEDAINAFNQHPNAAGFYGNTLVIDAATRETIDKMGLSTREGYIPPEEFVEGFLVGQIFVPGSSAVWSKKALDDAGGYPLDLGPKSDYYINHLLPSLSGVVYKNREYHAFRVPHDKTNFGNSGNLRQRLEWLQMVEQKLCAASPIFKSSDKWDFWRSGEYFSVFKSANASGTLFKIFEYFGVFFKKILSDKNFFYLKKIVNLTIRSPYIYIKCKKLK